MGGRGAGALGALVDLADDLAPPAHQRDQAAKGLQLLHSPVALLAAREQLAGFGSLQRQLALVVAEQAELFGQVRAGQPAELGLSLAPVASVTSLTLAPQTAWISPASAVKST